VTSFAIHCVLGTKLGKFQTSDRALADAELVARISHHDREAFTCLLNRHVDAMHRYVYRLTGSPHDAEELTQETFLRVWQKASSYKSNQGKVSTWLYRIAHNLCIDGFRKRTPDLADEPLETVVDPRANTETELDHERQLAQLQSALNALPQTQRSALVLCQVQGFSNADAAKILNISVHALESLLARARRSLRNNFDPKIQHP
jgi:RNA polymerase sigma-70 factor (ECF subfamily)